MRSDPHARTFASDDLRLEGLSWAGRGTPTLLVHATSFCAATWRPVWSAVRAAGWNGPAAAFDQRGQGGSDAPPGRESYAWTCLAADVAAVAEIVRADQEQTQSFLVGHSSGATSALVVAGQTPEQIAGLVLIEPVLYETPGSEAGDTFAGSAALAERTRRRRAVFPSRDAALEKLRERFPYSRFAEDSLSAYGEAGLCERPDGSVCLCCEPEREAWLYEGAAALDLWPWVEKVRAPVLLILGEHSAVPAEFRQRLVDGLESLRFETVSGASHFAALEEPETVGKLVAEFALDCVRERGG